jgi:transposase
MSKPETITMTMRELDRLKVIQSVADSGLTVWRAAEKLGLSRRQVDRLVLRYRQDGASGLLSRKRGRDSNRQLPPGLESRARGLIRDTYADFSPTLACEKLRERHGIDLAKETVRRIMIDAGFWVPRKLRPPKVYQPRHRRACLGELIQIDGSDHRWFEGRAPACTLLVYVDDATRSPGASLYLARMAQGVAEPDLAVRQGHPSAGQSSCAGVKPRPRRRRCCTPSASG